MSPTTVKEREYMSYIPYASTVGSLMYNMVCIRPHLSQVVGMVNGYYHNLGKGHWKAVKWILGYIKCTINVGLIFEKDTNSKKECAGYVDSDYATGLDKRRSTMRYVFILSQAPISWRSNL